MKIKKQYPNPKFKDLQEEEQYWNTHSPLEEGFVGEVQLEKQKRSSFLSVRLTASELEQLKTMAKRLNTGPSTLARNIIKNALVNDTLNSNSLPIQIFPTFESDSNDDVLNLPKLDEKNRRLLVIDPYHFKPREDLLMDYFKIICKSFPCSFFKPEDDDYERLISSAKSEKK